MFGLNLESVSFGIMAVVKLRISQFWDHGSIQIVNQVQGSGSGSGSVSDSDSDSGSGCSIASVTIT